jgi:hypothetical protein
MADGFCGEREDALVVIPLSLVCGGLVEKEKGYYLRWHAGCGNQIKHSLIEISVSKALVLRLCIKEKRSTQDELGYKS